MRTLLDLLLRGSFATRIWTPTHARLVTFLLIAMLVTLVLLGLPGLDSPLPCDLDNLLPCKSVFSCASLMPRYFKKCYLHLLARWCDKFEAFSTSKTAPIVTDHYMVKEHAIVFHDICADRATGYPGFLSQLSLVRGEYGDVRQSQLWMQFLQESQWLWRCCLQILKW